MTIKQKLVAKSIMKNHGNMSQAMREAGYKESSIHTPDAVTKSKGWLELMDKYLADDKLLRKHEEAMEATKWNDFTGEREEDHTTRLKAVDMGYKVKGKYNEPSGNTTNILVIPGELLNKYGISSDTKDSSTGQS